jgi:hypothetical protein
MDLDRDKIERFYKNNYSNLVEQSKMFGANGFSEDAVQDDFLWALEMMNSSSPDINEHAIFGHLKTESIKYFVQEKSFCCDEGLTYLTDPDF